MIGGKAAGHQGETFMFRIAVALLIAFIVPILITPLFIRIQRRFKIGQKIRQEGPDLHQYKTGTPTMGGLVIFFSVALSLLFFQPEHVEVYAAFALLCSFGFVGFLDDFIKYYKGRSLGLKARVKIVLQLLVGLLFLSWMFHDQAVSTEMLVPFNQQPIPMVKMIYLPFLMLVLISSTNAVNLTDGLDGLATGLMIIALGAFAIIAFSREQEQLGVLTLMIIFSCAGFLFFNFHPARIFLGDVGALGLGGGMAAIAVLTGTELFLLIIGGVFVIETLSVIIQVLSIQVNHKPVFKMAPLHHHFELSKWEEVRIVLTFWGAGLVLAILGLGIYFLH